MCIFINTFCRKIIWKNKLDFLFKNMIKEEEAAFGTQFTKNSEEGKESQAAGNRIPLWGWRADRLFPPLPVAELPQGSAWRSSPSRSGPAGSICSMSQRSWMLKKKNTSGRKKIIITMIDPDLNIYLSWGIFSRERGSEPKTSSSSRYSFSWTSSEVDRKWRAQIHTDKATHATFFIIDIVLRWKEKMSRSTHSWQWWHIQPKWKPYSPPWSERADSIVSAEHSADRAAAVNHLALSEAGLEQRVHKHRLLPLGFSFLRHGQQHRLHLGQSWTARFNWLLHLRHKDDEVWVCL